MCYEEWIGKTETVTDVAAATPYAALAATLNREAERPPVGTRLPALWHWLYFLPLHRTADLGLDGHAERGGFLPPVLLPRRMWAASRFLFVQPLFIGDALTRVSTIEDVTEKIGRTGRLVFVTVRHEIRRGDDADVALTELHDIVYREAPTPEDKAPPPRVAPIAATWERKWIPDATLLFRYSALTFNGHRIHYDRRYVTEAEGYPGLIVHGPLLATLLLDLLRRELPDASVVRYEFRAVRPTFDTHPFFVCGDPQADGKTFHLWAKDHESFLTMDATAVIE